MKHVATRVAAAMAAVALVLVLSAATDARTKGKELKVHGGVTPSLLESDSAVDYVVRGDLSKVKFIGTSVLHHFKGVSRSVSGYTTIRWSEPLEAEGEIVIPVRSLQGYAFGGKKKKLTRNIHLGLEADKYPNIAFTIKDVKPVEFDPEKERGEFLVRGDLEIHNVTHEVSVPVKMELQSGFLHFHGKYAGLDMKQYGLRPKTLMGVFRPKSKVDVVFDIYEDVRGGAEGGVE